MNVTFPGLAPIHGDSVRDLCIKAENELRDRFKARRSIQFTASNSSILLYLTDVVLELTNDAILEVATTVREMKGS